MISTSYGDFITKSHFVCFKAVFEKTSLYCVVHADTETCFYVTEADLQLFMDRHDLKIREEDLFLRLRCAKVIGSCKMWIKHMMALEISTPELDLMLRKITHAEDIRRIDEIHACAERVHELLLNVSAPKKANILEESLGLHRRKRGLILAQNEEFVVQNTDGGLILHEKAKIEPIEVKTGERATIDYWATRRGQAIKKVVEKTASKMIFSNNNRANRKVS